MRKLLRRRWIRSGLRRIRSRAIRAAASSSARTIAIGFQGVGVVLVTTDVFIIMPVKAINTRYFAHFGAPDEFASPVAAEFGPLN